eukprot:GFKZ01002401.1.p1 GENE.GFKZ01002401.1~~GFKZ01002401.1.p1  ORF type:complete len:167 (-),score=12.32 GFKZ01002401.1:690-1190(-)
MDDIANAMSSKKGGGASEWDLAAQKPRPTATWRHSVTGGIFTARIHAGSLSDGGKRNTGVQRGASRRVSLRYDMTGGKLDGFLVESDNMLELGRRWTARYLDSDGDWIIPLLYSNAVRADPSAFIARGRRQSRFYIFSETKCYDIMCLPRRMFRRFEKVLGYRMPS